MKPFTKILLAAFLFFATAGAFAQSRTIYITRHGQRGDPKYQRRFKFCDEDALMPDGETQAHLLGTYLASLGFEGTIYVSPYYRTLQTATFAAEELPPSCKMILEPRLQEMAGVKDSSGVVRTTKKCITKKEIKRNFPHVQIPRKMKFPWRLENEKQSQLDERVNGLIDELLLTTNGDVFLVAHGGMMPRFTNAMVERGAEFPKRKTYNCCLYAFTFDTETGLVTQAVDHTLNYLGAGLVTDNLVYIPIGE